MTTDPTQDQLSAWTAEANEYMTKTGRKVFPFEIQDELVTRGARRCPNCTEVKALTEFASNTANRNGLQSRCRPCQNECCAKSHAANRPNRLEYKRRYYVDNREQEIARTHQYHLDHPWGRALGDGYRRAVEAGTRADWITEAELLAYWESQGINPNECFYSGLPIVAGETRSLDHLVPISEGGAHSLENLRPAHLSMNVSKGKNRAVEWVVTTQPGTKTLAKELIV